MSHFDISKLGRAKCAHLRLIKPILILCEGAKTEPYYFDKFPVNPTKYRIIAEKGEHTDAKGIVDEAIERRQDGYKSIWCVFDKDRNRDADFNNAIAHAKANGIRCAYSNECFELWYLIHFVPNQSALHRHGQGSYAKKLSGHLSLNKHGEYEKNREDMYELLLSRQKIAIRNAETLFSKHPTHTSPAKNNPITTVHLLVKELKTLSR